MQYLTQIHGPFPETIEIKDGEQLERLAFHLADWCPLDEINRLNNKHITIKLQGSNQGQSVATLGEFLIGQTGLLELEGAFLNECKSITIAQRTEDNSDINERIFDTASLELWTTQTQLSGST